jgi:hypothetical protein
MAPYSPAATNVPYAPHNPALPPPVVNPILTMKTHLEPDRFGAPREARTIVLPTSR